MTYRVLLADDNPIILKKFEQLLPWEQYGYQLVGSAIDGMDGWELFQRYRPHIVITDIQMPVYTGIELAKKIRACNSNTLVLFLTCHEEIEYLRNAIELGVRKYLLKHEVTPQLLLQTLEQLKQHIMSPLMESRLRNSLFAELIEQGRRGKGQRKMPHGELKKYFPGLYDIVCIYHSRILAPLSRIASERSEIPLSLLSMPELEATAEMVAICEGSQTGAFCLFRHTGASLERYRQLVETLKIQRGTAHSAFILDKPSDIHRVESILRARPDVAELGFFYPPGTVTIIEIRTLSRRNYLHISDEELVVWVANAETGHLLQYIDTSLGDAIEERNIAELNRCTSQLIGLLLRYHRRVLDVRKPGVFFAYDASSFASWYDAISFYHWVRGKLAELASLLVLDRWKVHSDKLQTAITHIAKHFQDPNLGADEIANEAKISISRLNHLFKEETGRTLGCFLGALRMERARQLVVETKFSISEIVQSCGFRNLSYFSKVFRQTFGTSPGEYRRRYHQD